MVIDSEVNPPTSLRRSRTQMRSGDVEHTERMARTVTHKTLVSETRVSRHPLSIAQDGGTRKVQLVEQESMHIKEKVQKQAEQITALTQEVR